MTKFNWLILLLLLPLSALAQSWQADSGDRQKAVVELFTAEGCGLCPPADKWVDQLADNASTDDRMIVLGFHIDYLNQKKGWIDRFAQPRFTDRQRQLARLNLFESVYTPEVVISGEVVHLWREHGEEMIRFVNDFAPEARIHLKVEKTKAQLVINSRIQVSGADNRNHAKLYIAVTEDGIESHVKGGDNAGRTFIHQHLVRDWLGPFDLDHDGDSNIATTVALGDDWVRQQLKVVAVVQNLYDGFVLQGLALPLKN